MAFFRQTDMFSSTQHGFLKGKSTTTAIFEYFEYDLKSLDDKELIIGLFLDLSKAFDCVDFEILITKLYRCGIRGLPLRLIENYLNNRKQYVSLITKNGEIRSDLRDVNIGIPQGSILGPLLFLIYVYDLIVTHKDSFLVQFADDTSLAIKGKNYTALIKLAQEFINEINQWFSINKLKLNASKTNIVNFQLYNKRNIITDSTINCDEKLIQFVDECKLLGVTIDKNVRWENHINKLCNKLSKSLYALRILKNTVTQDVLLQVYHAYFQSHLTYAVEIWGHAAGCFVDRVFVLQKKAVRIICGAPPYSSCRKLFPSINVLPFYALYIYKVLLFVRTHNQYFENTMPSHDYSTRNKQLYVLNKHKTTSYERGLSYKAKKFYNNLPQNIKDIELFTSYKKAVKTYLQSKCIYSINDFFSG